MIIHERTNDAIVIGGGLAGLAAAVYLARAGRSVTVLEKADGLGGRGRTVSRNGALLNLGVHALYRGGAAEEVLQELNVPLEGDYPPTAAIAVMNRRVFPFPASAAKLLTSKLFPFAAKIELARLLTSMTKVDPATYDDISFREWAEASIREPMVRHLIYSVCRTATYVPRPELQRAGPALRRLQLALKGQAFYVERGWGTLVNGLQAAAQKDGVIIATHRQAVELLCDGGQVTGVRLADGERLHAPNVLVAAGPDDLCRLVPGSEDTGLASWRHDAQPVKAACLDLVLRRLPNSRHPFVAGFWLDQPLFYSNPTSVVHVAEGDTVVLHLVKHLGGYPAQPKLDEAQLEQALDDVHPGWRREELGRQFLPDMTVAHDFYRMDRKVAFDGPDVPGVDGLFVAGDWAGSGEMLVDASFASARRAAKTMLQRRGRA